MTVVLPHINTVATLSCEMQKL